MSGFCVEEQPDGILVYRFEDFCRDTTNDWVEQVRALKVHYDKKGWHLRELYLVPATTLPTPYATRVAIGLAAARPKTLALSTAVVLTNSNISFAMHHILSRVPSAKYVHPVNTAEEGVAWLNERHSKYRQGIALEY